ncbi:MAG: hypothetical protein D6767_03555 [Candidatus Hydrogenedentota bacterium]|nr:MAG: hypothetical protein D6767_03555 [Candidatus Hydrogenedentota bacterium]
MQTTLEAVKCNSCGFLHPVGIFCCPKCGSEDIEQIETEASGKIYSYTVHTFVPAGPLKSRAPYVLAIVETKDGMRFSAIVDYEDPNSVKIDDPVVFKGFEEGVGPIYQFAG